MTPTVLQPSSLPLLAGVVCLLYFCYRRCLPRPFPNIPYNQEATRTFFGDGTELFKVGARGGSPYEWLVSQTVRHNSPIVQVFLRPLSDPWVLIADFEECQDVLYRRAKEFDRSPTLADVFGGIAPEFHLNFVSADERFKTHRALLRDLMTPAFLNQVHASVSNLVQLWSIKSRLAQGHPFEALGDTFDIMLDSITSVAFGLDTKESVTALRVEHILKHGHVNIPQNMKDPVHFDLPPRPPTYQALVRLLDSVNSAARSPLPRLMNWRERQKSAYRKAHRVKEDMINAEIRRGVARIQKGDTTQRSALDNILQRETAAAQKAGRQPRYETDGIRDELFGFLLAGHETTAATMSFGFKFLSANPPIQTLLRSQLRRRFPQAQAEGRDPTADEITKAHVPYLEAVLEEIHRCAHVFSTIMRKALVDTTVLGHPISKGTQVILAAAGPSYQTPAFPIDESKRSDSYRSSKHDVGSWDPADAELFKPERWLKKATTATNGQEEVVFDANAGPMLAFGAGPRGCFGKRLAYLQMKVLLVLVLWNLELLEVDGPLGSFDPAKKFTRQPINFYLRLREAVM